jgi:hypothetical protein
MEEAKQVVLYVQMGLFNFTTRIPRPENLWNSVKEKMPGVFDGTPTIRPVDDTPENYNQWVLHLSSSDVFTLDIARSRVDFYMTGRGLQALSDVRDGFTGHAADIADMFVDQHAERIGIVAKFFYQTTSPHETAARLLSPAAVTDGFGSVTVRYLVHAKFGVLAVNDTTVVDSSTVATIYGVGSDLKGVQLTRDLNLAQEEQWSSSRENVSDFLNWALGSLGLEKMENMLWAK